MKAINIIFTEHSKLKIENPLLKQKISALEELTKDYEVKDSLYCEEINKYKEKVSSDAITIKKLNSYKKNSIKIFSAGGIVLFLLGLIL